MCDSSSLPTEIILYDNQKLNIYINSKLTNSIDVEDKIKLLYQIFPLPDRKFILSYKSDKHMIAIYDGNKLIYYVLYINNFPPVIDGTFVSTSKYFQIKSDGSININNFNDDTVKYMPANIKADNESSACG